MKRRLRLQGEVRDATQLAVECVGEAGVLFDPLDPTAIAEAINKVANDESLRRRLVQLGFNRLSSYQWRNVVPKILEVYRQAAYQDGGEQRD